MSSKNLGGRPQKYKTEDLLQALYDYVAKETPSKVTNAGLVRNTNYPIQAWRFNKEVQEAIEEINLKINNLSKISGVSNSKDLLVIPNAEEMVQTNYDNKEKLIDAIQSLIDVYQLNLKKCLKLQKIEQEFHDLKKENANLKKEVDFYQNKLKEMTVKSHNNYERDQNGLVKDELNIKEFSHTMTTFKDLFDD